jgi:hypothetical protein
VGAIQDRHNNRLSKANHIAVAEIALSIATVAETVAM